MTDFGWSYPPGCTGTPDDEKRDVMEPQYFREIDGHIQYMIIDHLEETDVIVEYNKETRVYECLSCREDEPCEHIKFIKAYDGKIPQQPEHTVPCDNLYCSICMGVAGTDQFENLHNAEGAW